MYSIRASANAGSSLRGWMQSTGQTSTQAVSLVSTHGSQMMYATGLGQYTRMLLAGLLLLLSSLPGWTESPLHAALFTPRRASATFRAYVTPRPLDEVVADLQRMTPGGFTPEALIAADAFGRSGTYNRWTLARLYGARRARVARGPRIDHGQVVEAWTLISPYPSADLGRLEPGTLLIVLDLR